MKNTNSNNKETRLDEKSIAELVAQKNAILDAANDIKTRLGVDLLNTNCIKNLNG